MDNTWSTTTMSPYDATVSSPDSVENRLTALERQVAHLREQNALIASDASAARTLAAGADRDVSEVRAELRAHTQVLNSLRETQLEQGQTMRAGFAGVNAGMEQIVALLDRITGPDAD